MTEKTEIDIARGLAQTFVRMVPKIADNHPQYNPVSIAMSAAGAAMAALAVQEDIDPQHFAEILDNMAKSYHLLYDMAKSQGVHLWQK